MSKSDALRAMREAKYAANASRTAAQPTRKVAAPAPAPAATKSNRSAPEADVASDELCGHRNMSGRECTREKGHSAKSHRYGASATN